MTPERNMPCPCGSGKKYKKCCGAPNQNKGEVTACNRASAYEGELGRRREAFCREYTEYKKARLAGISAALRRSVEAEGKTISCAKGCSHCCHVYVAATLQECEAIAYFLYYHEDALKAFLENYARWSEAVKGTGTVFKDISRIRSKQMAGTDSPEDQAALRAALDAYVAKAIPCPFLKEGACSIYEVRPYVCAGVVSVTPPAWCLHANPENLKAEIVRQEIRLYEDMPHFASPYGKVMVSSLPALVHGLIVRGKEILRATQGFQEVGG